MWLFLGRHTDLLAHPQRLLHFAPERALVARLRSVHAGGYVSGDIIPGRAMEELDITAIDKPNDAFDAVLCSHVLEHVPDDLAGMREIARVLAPAGMAILQHPIDFGLSATYEDPMIASPQQRQAAYNHRDHKRLYGSDFPDRLASAGLIAEHFKAADFATQDEIGRYGLWEPLGTYHLSDVWLCRHARDNRI